MEIQMDNLEKLYADTFKGLKTGAITTGKVIQVKSDGLIVDVGSKCEGFVPLHELNEDELAKLTPGDEVEVYIVRLSDSDGFVKLSRQKAEGAKTWDMLDEAMKDNKPVEGKIRS